VIIATSKSTQPLAGFWCGRIAPVRKSHDGVKTVWIELAKVDEWKRLVTGIVLQPEVVDAQGDIMDADVIKDAAHDFLALYNEATKLGRGHKVFNIPLDLVESYIVPETTILNGRTIRKGTWMMTTRVVDDDTWDDVLAGKLRGYSIAGMAKAIPV